MAENTLIAEPQGDTDAGQQVATEALTKDAAPASTEGQEQPTGTQEPEAKAEAPAVPEKYEFKFAEGVQVDEATLGAISEQAKDLGLTQEQAQKYADLKVKDQMAQAESHHKTVADWRKASETDKEFGGEKLKENLGVARRAIDQFMTPEFKEILDKTGFGNHPEVIRTFYKVGLAISEDGKVVKGGAPKASRSAAEVLYGKSS